MAATSEHGPADAQAAAATDIATDIPAPAALLAIHDFRLLIAMQLVTGVRLPLQFFAQTWYVNVAAPEDQRLLLLGLLATLRGAAFVAWVLFGGALADRFPRRQMLTIAHSAGFLVVLGTGLLLYLPGASGGEGLWFPLLLLLFAELGLMDAQDLPARNALIVDVVPERLRTSAMTMNWLALPATMLIMMPLSGWLIDVLGYGTMYVLASLAHLVVLVALRRMRLRGGAADGAAAGESMLDNVRAGVGYLRTEPAVRWTVYLLWIVMLGGNTLLWVLGAAWMRDVLALDAAGWGRVALFWGVGGVLASGVLLWSGEYGRKGALLLCGAVLFGVAVLVFALTRSVALAALSFGLSGVAFQLVMTASMAIVQQQVPNRLLGRVMGLLLLANGIAQLLGVVLGAIAELVGLEALYLVIALAMTAAAVAVMLSQRPLRSLS